MLVSDIYNVALGKISSVPNLKYVKMAPITAILLLKIKKAAYQRKFSTEIDIHDKDVIRDTVELLDLLGYDLYYGMYELKTDQISNRYLWVSWNLRPELN